MGVTEALLKVDGTMPDSRDELIISIMRGHRAGSEDFTRVVGMGSREQVEAFAWETNLATEMVHRREGGERALGQANIYCESFILNEKMYITKIAQDIFPLFFPYCIPLVGQNSKPYISALTFFCFPFCLCAAVNIARRQKQ